MKCSCCNKSDSKIILTYPNSKYNVCSACTKCNLEECKQK